MSLKICFVFFLIQNVVNKESFLKVLADLLRGEFILIFIEIAGMHARRIGPVLFFFTFIFQRMNLNSKSIRS